MRERRGGKKRSERERGSERERERERERKREIAAYTHERNMCNTPPLMTLRLHNSNVANVRTHTVHTRARDSRTLLSRLT